MEILSYQQKWYQKNRVRLLKKFREYQIQNREKICAYRRKWNLKQRTICLKYYGGDPPKCACCGETIFEFLGIDHINGGGQTHKKEIKRLVIYRWLILNNFPKGYRVLCHNCNLARGFYGECPHERQKFYGLDSSRPSFSGSEETCGGS